MDTGAPHNPFSSHLLEPARGGYIFPPGKSFAEVMATLEKSRWRGELTGRHGAGKSTLLADICGELEQRGLKAIWWQSSDRRRLFPRSWLRDIGRADVIAYDGAERLLPGLLLLLRGLTRIMGRGLIITSHRVHGFGAVIPIEADARLLVKKFIPEQLAGHPEEDWVRKIETALAQHGGNSRQVLFDLYMEYEDKFTQDEERGKQ